MKVFHTRLPLFIIVLILTAACLAAPCYFIYMNARGIVVDELGNNAIDIAVAVAAFIERDIDEYSELPAQSFSLPGSGQSDDDTTSDTANTQKPQASVTGDSIPIEETEPTAVSSGAYNEDAAYDSGYDEGYDAGYDDGYNGYDYIDSAGTYEDSSYDLGFADGYYDGYYDGDYNYHNTYGDSDGTDEDATNNDAANSDGSGSRYILGSAGSSTHASPLNDVVSYNEQYFNGIIVLLEKIQRETGASKIYTEKKLSSTKKGYVFKDNYVPEDRFLSGDLTEEEILAFNEGVNSSTGVLQDESLGEYIKGYAPIIDIRTSKTVGVVVVEFALADAVSLTSEVLILIISCFVMLALLATFVVYRLCMSRMKYLSRDVLTDLGNKRYFESNLKREIRSARNLKHPLSLMMIDVDMFKGINDSLGHMTGDMVLKAVSGVLLKCTRRGDICCRYGGDEFVIMLPGSNRMQAAAIAERIRQEVGALRFASENGPFGVTLSIGVAELSSDMTADSFKETADKTLYYSKNTGKNRITVYNNTQNISI